jgi:hypothetical protein
LIKNGQDTNHKEHQNVYGGYIPNKKDLNCDAPNTPSNFLKPFNIETQSFQNSIGNENYFNPNDVFFDENKSSKRIAQPPHVNLNLLYSNVNSNKKDSSLKISTTSRVGNKFVTIVYYKPISSI